MQLAHMDDEMELGDLDDMGAEQILSQLQVETGVSKEELVRTMGCAYLNPLGIAQ